MENPYEIIMEKLNRIETMLSDIKRDYACLNNNSEKSQEILNMDQAAALLTMSKPTLYNYTANRKIPHFKLEKRIYFKKSELVEWITKSKVLTVKEFDQEANNYIQRRGSKLK